MAPEHVQHAIVGSGPGGALSAALLAEAGAQVLVLEQGPEIPLEQTKPFGAAEMAEKYRNGGLTVAFGAPRVAYVEGQCLGGGSEVNSGLYFGPPPELLGQWAARHRVQDTASILAAARQVEQDLRIQPMPGALPPASLKLAQGAQALGWAAQEVPRWYDYGADGTPAKQSMSRTYLPRARRAGAQVRTGVRVVGLRHLGSVWELQMQTVGTHGLRLLHADHVFLCAGTIQSAALLRRSRLSRRAGRSLYMHPSIKVTALFDEVVNSSAAPVPVHQVKEFAPRISLGGSISHPHHLRLALMDYPDGDALVASHWQCMATYYAMTADGHGCVIPLPGFDDPLVRYRVGTLGEAHLREGLEHLCDCLFAAGARALYPAVAQGQVLHCMDEARALVRRLEARDIQPMTIHLMGSCPMGEDPTTSAVDSFGRVHGQEHLYVNDASILPSALGVNPQGTVLAVAMRNIRHFLK